MNRYTFNALCIFILSILFSCANQTAPQGGPKDEDPPKLVKSTPSQKQTNFIGQKIELYFDEYIATNQPKQEIIITPRIEQEYEIKSRKNIITITLEQPLDDSTTYTINFRESIQDITEKNSPTDLKLAFSTGPYMDSMSISGTVKDLLTQKILEDVTVGLYIPNDTLDVLTDSPNYFTKTTEDGTYQIENIKIGTYQVFAFKDSNKNLTPQTSTEAYGYRLEPILLDTILKDIDFNLISLNLDTLQLTRARQIATTFHIKYNKYITDYTIVTFDSVDQVISNFTDNTHETIQIYNTFPIADSIPIFVTAFDSLQQSSIDTLFLQFKETTRKPAEFNNTIDLDKVTTNDKTLNASLKFTKPITQINFDSTYIYIDSTHVYPLDSSHFTWNTINDNLTIQYILADSVFDTKTEEQKVNNDAPQTENSLDSIQADTASDTTQVQAKPEDVPHLYLGHGSFISVEHDSTAIIKKVLTFNRPESLGLIEFSVNTDQPCYFLQVLDDKYKLVRELYNPTSQELQNLDPGSYKLRIIIDSNCNKQWDLGNLLNKVNPERVIIYKLPDDIEDIILRANWVYPLGIIEF